MKAVNYKRLLIVVFFFIGTNTLFAGPGDEKKTTKTAVSAVPAQQKGNPQQEFERERKGRRWVCRINQAR